LFVKVGFGGIAGIVEVEHHKEVLYGHPCRFKIGCPALLFLNGPEQQFGFFGVIPETLLMGNFFFFLYLFKSGINVKGTSLKHQAFSECHSTDLSEP